MKNFFRFLIIYLINFCIIRALVELTLNIKRKIGGGDYEKNKI